MLFPVRILLLLNPLAVQSKRIIFQKSIIEKVGNNDYSNDYPAVGEAEGKKKKKIMIEIAKDMKNLKKKKDMKEEVLLSDNDYDDYEEDEMTRVGQSQDYGHEQGQDYFKLHYGYDYSDRSYNDYMDHTLIGDRVSLHYSLMAFSVII